MLNAAAIGFRSVMAWFLMACISAFVLFSLLTLGLLYGRERAWYKTNYVLHRIIERLSSEGRHQKAPCGVERKRA